MGLSYSNLIKKLLIYLSSDWQHPHAAQTDIFTLSTAGPVA